MKPLDEVKHPKTWYSSERACPERVSNRPISTPPNTPTNKDNKNNNSTLSGTQIPLHNIPKAALPPGHYSAEATIEIVDGKVRIFPDLKTVREHPQATKSDPSHLDWKLSDAFTPDISMAEHRKQHPKPALFDLIHQWNLSDIQQSQLDYYKLASMTAAQLENALADNYNKIYQRESNKMYIPIYQYTTRTQIKFDSRGRFYQAKYYLSFRSIGEFQFVLIQRSRNATI